PAFTVRSMPRRISLSSTRACRLLISSIESFSRLEPIRRRQPGDSPQLRHLRIYVVGLTSCEPIFGRAEDYADIEYVFLVPPVSGFSTADWAVEQFLPQLAASQSDRLLVQQEAIPHVIKHPPRRSPASLVLEPNAQNIALGNYTNATY